MRPYLEFGGAVAEHADEIVTVLVASRDRYLRRRWRDRTGFGRARVDRPSGAVESMEQGRSAGIEPFGVGFVTPVPRRPTEDLSTAWDGDVDHFDRH